ncbi:MAG: hypothetical protein IH621_15865 [Krumholzibacteria bacterium]|nr:hypothetical protein [Candidatus Krumholzibacteria bacterium]
MPFTVAEIVKPMMAAAQESLAKDWGQAKDYARPELKRLATSLADIAKLIAADKVNRRQAKALLRIHRNTTLTVLLTVEGLGVVAVEDAINAALGAVRDVVNTAVGFRLV